MLGKSSVPGFGTADIHHPVPAPLKLVGHRNNGQKEKGQVSIYDKCQEFRPEPPTPHWLYIEVAESTRYGKSEKDKSAG
jgi:hypothetical protein